MSSILADPYPDTPWFVIDRGEKAVHIQPILSTDTTLIYQKSIRYYLAQLHSCKYISIGTLLGGVIEEIARAGIDVTRSNSMSIR